MTNRIRKFLLGIAAVIFIAAVPQVRGALANEQAPVDHRSIRIQVDGIFSGAYNLTFQWQRPDPPQPPVERWDGVPRPILPGSPHPSIIRPGGTPNTIVFHLRGNQALTDGVDGDGSAYFYWVERSAPNSIAAPFTRIIPDYLTRHTEPGGENSPMVAHSVNNVPLTGGSVYAFRIVPFHRHLSFSWQPAPPPALPLEGSWSVPAGPTDAMADMPLGQVALLLTEISVTATPRLDGFDITWQSPVVAGHTIFEHWVISYMHTGTGTFQSSLTTRTITVSESQLEREGNNVTFFLPGTDLAILQAYDFGVEPINGPNPAAGAFRPQFGMTEPSPRVPIHVLPGGPHWLYFPRLNPATDDGAFVDRNRVLPVRLSVGNYDAANILIDWFGFGNVQVSDVRVLMGSRENLEAYRDAGMPLSPPGDPNGIVPPQFQLVELGRIFGQDNTSRITSLITQRPADTTYFMLRIQRAGVPLPPPDASEIAQYDPELPAFRPTAPIIRNFFSPRPRPPVRLTVEWYAFLRSPLTDMEAEHAAATRRGIPNMVWDTFVEYDIFITDDLDFLTGMPGMAADVRFVNPDRPSGSWLSSELFTDFEHYTHRLSIDRYFSSEHQQWRDITENKLYYIKIIAWQVNTDGNRTTMRSDPAQSAAFVDSDSLVTRPPMMSKPPFRVRTLDGALDIGTSHITVEWALRYYEAFVQGTWATRFIYRSGVGFILLDNTVPLDTDVIIDLTPRDDLMILSTPNMRHYVYDHITDNYLGGLPVEERALLPARLPLRFVDFVDPAPPAQFALLWVPYESVRHMDLQTYIDDFVRGYMSGAAWPGNPFGEIGIAPVPAGQISASGVWMHHPAMNLSQHTTYMFLLWPYLPVPAPGWPSGYIAYEPANLIATTIADHDDVYIVPAVPMLEPIDAGDMWLEVGWFYDNRERIFYTLYYSELVTDYPEGRMFPPITITNAHLRGDDDEHFGLIRTELRTNPATGQMEPYVVFRIPNLFPETTYHIWIRAHATGNPGTTGPTSSRYSNYVTMRTLEIRPPASPTGLGLVGGVNLGIINLMNDTAYIQVYRDYIIFEWNVIYYHERQRYRERPYLRPSNTVVPATGAITTNPPGYTLDGVWETLSTYILKIGGLEPNMAYYARVKTRLTVTNSRPNITEEYQYVFQLSETEDFFSFIEVIIPATIAGGTGQFLQRDSVWHGPIRVFTDVWTGEHDGDIDPETYPLPDDDFEWIYDPVTQTLTYRFRSMGVDAYGHRDNWVDQRFINWLIASRIYNFTIPFDRHPFGNVPIRRFEMVMPFSILSAMSDRHISLTLIMESTTYTFHARVLDVPEIRNMPGFGLGTYISIMSEKNPAGVPAIQPEVSTFASPPARLTIRAESGTNAVSIDRTIIAFIVSQHVANHTLFHEGSVSGFTSTFAAQQWNRGNYRLVPAERIVQQSTNEVGTYAAINFFTPVILTADRDVTASVERVSRFIVFEGMQTISPGDTITSEQFNKMTAAIAAGSSAVNLNAPLASAEFNSLSRAGLLVMSGDTVSRQEAVSTLVRLYELVSRSRITDYTPLRQQSMFLDIAAADERFHSNLLKAADLGFFEYRPNSVRPHDDMTLGELIRIIDLIVEFAGL